MSMPTLSPMLKTESAPLVRLVVNGWMSGSNTGVVLTGGCVPVNNPEQVRSGLPVSTHSLILFE